MEKFNVSKCLWQRRILEEYFSYEAPCQAAKIRRVLTRRAAFPCFEYLQDKAHCPARITQTSKNTSVPIFDNAEPEMPPPLEEEEEEEDDVPPETSSTTASATTPCVMM